MADRRMHEDSVAWWIHHHLLIFGSKTVYEPGVLTPVSLMCVCVMWGHHG